MARAALRETELRAGQHDVLTCSSSLRQRAGQHDALERANGTPSIGGGLRGWVFRKHFTKTKNLIFRATKAKVRAFALRRARVRGG